MKIYYFVIQDITLFQNSFRIIVI